MKSILLPVFLFACATKNTGSEELNNIETTQQEVSRQATPKKDATPIQAVLEQAPAEGLDKAALFENAPEAAQALLPLLSAHHAADLPTQETLAAHPQAEEGLRWIAESDSHFGLRGRAIFLLHLYDSPETLALLGQFASAVEGPYGLRASAFDAMAQWPSAKREAHIDWIAAGLEDAHPVVVVSAIHAAKGLAELEAKVSEVQSTHSSPIVRKTAEDE